MLSVAFQNDGSTLNFDSCVEISRGPSNITYRARCATNGSVVLKRSRGGVFDAMVNSPRMISSCAYSQVTSNPIWQESGMSSFCKGTATPTLAASLLADEVNRIEYTRGAWNHRVLRAGPAIFSQDNNPIACFVLLMPDHPGTTMDKLDRSTQRALWPRMLPALWKALCVLPHNALTNKHILVSPDRRQFTLLSPGCLCSTYSQGQDGCNDVQIQYTFYTDERHYPMLLPHSTVELQQDMGVVSCFEEQCLRLAWDVAAGVGLSVQDRPRMKSCWGPRTHSGASFVRDGILETWGNVSPARVPKAADFFALGLMYYHALSGILPFDLKEVAWFGQPSVRRLNELLAICRIPPRPPCELASDVSKAESDLALALLDLRWEALQPLAMAASHTQ